ncbi:Na/Pi cotransporter family protein [Consotaella salsifontis]|uniref:Phosphate:Na+ symporter n=1 Tax=Consotaella salsifontis TaxID=1365950 RepID=A0A1T4TBU5_9HYPH|nr:Na/Pi cotransporter family protein [Consotaella salsifontis]SKA37689.1 phosphate:Na+ symporter [Consotaella salsifontis]
MSTANVLISLGGGVALLLWGIHMISGGVQRALGSRLRGVLAFGLSNRFSAFSLGLVVTALLQSSTATALMTTSLAAGGAMDLIAALAVMLGANVGTTLIVQVVAFDITMVFPALILFGFIINRKARQATARDAGSALVGLGLVLLSLHLLTEVMRPVENSQALRLLLQSMTSDALLSAILAAILAWAAHSSVAAMLFIMSLAGSNVVPAPAALAMVIGANLGSALNPLSAAMGGDPTRLRVPVGNLITRLVGAAVSLPLIGPISDALLALDPSPVRAAAHFHLLFNVAIAGLFLGLLPLEARLLTRLFPMKVESSDPGAPLHLDEAALRVPSVALSNAAREVLRMADVVEEMLRGSQDVLHRGDRDRIAEISRMDDSLDRLNRAIQRYLGAIDQENLRESDTRRLSDILALAINLEHIGDIIDKNLMELARRRLKSGLQFSAEDSASIGEMHSRLLDHLQLAVSVFMFGNVEAARRLVAEKEGFRDIERQVTQRHVLHMRSGRRDEIETGSIHLDVTRDLKRIEAHIAATAYGVLEKHGELRNSRLTSHAAGEAG